MAKFHKSFSSKTIFLLVVTYLTFGESLLQTLNSTDQKRMLMIKTATAELKSLGITPLDEEDASLSAPALIQKRGFIAETHNVKTDDGYILTLHRIVNPNPAQSESEGGTNKPVAFVQHGLFSSSACYLLSSRDTSLTYILADNGYDVWLGNFRGNRYSQNHIRYSVDDSSFWDFSWHEMGIYDLPACIDYVLAHTKQSKLSYIGHSMGTTTFFVMGSERPDYMNKINSMTALAPVANVDHMASPMRNLAFMSDEITWMTTTFGSGKFPFSDPLLKMLGSAICSETNPFQSMCANALFLICGTSDHFDMQLLPTVMGQHPDETSVKTVDHYASNIKGQEFKKYDYGWVKNLYYYGSLSPPLYKLSNVKCPVGLFYGDNDGLAAIKDVSRLYAKLPNVVNNCLMPAGYNHLDVIYSKGVNDEVNSKVMAHIKRFQ